MGDMQKPMAYTEGQPQAPLMGQPQPTPGYAGVPQQGQPQVVYVQGGVGGRVKAPRVPYQTQCQKCQRQVLTNVGFKNGIFAYGAAGAICLFTGLWCGCCLIPLFIEACQDAQHFCPNCGMLVGENRVVDF